MSDRAGAYLKTWIRDNPAAVADDGTACANALLADAHRLGMSLKEFEEEVGDLPAHLATAMAERMSDAGREQMERGATDS